MDAYQDEILDCNLSVINNSISLINNNINNIQTKVNSLESNILHIQQNINNFDKNLTSIATQECNKSISTLNYDATFDKMLSITENTIATAGNSISHVDSAIAGYLGAMTLFIAVIALFLQWALNKEKEKRINEAINNILDELSKNDAMRDQLIQKIFNDEDFKQRFDILISQHFPDYTPNGTPVEKETEAEIKARENIKSKISKEEK